MRIVFTFFDIYDIWIVRSTIFGKKNMTCEGCHIIRNNDCPGDNCEWFGCLHEHAEDNPEHALLENLLSRYPHSHIRRRLRVIDGIQGRRQYLNRLLWEIQLDNQIPGPLGGIGGIGMHINWLNHRIQHLNLQIDIVTVTAIQLAASMMDARWNLLDIRELVNMAVGMADQALQDFQEGHGAAADNLGNAPQPPQGGEFPMAAFLEALQNPIDLFD